MAFLISSVSADVNLYDLGTVVIHPTVDRDLSLEFSAIELADSTLLTSAINNGTLTLKVVDDEYNTYSVEATEYYAGFSVQNQFLKSEIENYITEDELRAGVLNVLINPAATGISVTSTASSTKNVYSNSGKFQKWRLAPGDKVVIAGGAAAGTYTVDTVTDQYQFVVVESIPDTSGVGTLSLYHPVGGSKIGIDTSSLSNISGNTLQSVLGSIDTAITNVSGLTESQHKTLRQLIHFIDEGPAEGFTSGAFKEILPAGNPFPTSETWWTNVSKTHKIVELLITRNTNQTPNTEEWKIYDTDGVSVLATITDTYTYVGIFEVDKVRTIL